MVLKVRLTHRTDRITYRADLDAAVLPPIPEKRAKRSQTLALYVDRLPCKTGDVSRQDREALRLGHSTSFCVDKLLHLR